MVTRGTQKSLNFGNMISDLEDTGEGDHGRGSGGGGIGRILECWHCGWEHLKRDSQSAPKKGKKKTAAMTIDVLTGKQR